MRYLFGREEWRVEGVNGRSGISHTILLSGFFFSFFSAFMIYYCPWSRRITRILAEWFGSHKEIFILFQNWIYRHRFTDSDTAR